MPNLYTHMTLSDFSTAAYRAPNDKAPIKLTTRHRWRERGTRFVRFLTLRSFHGAKWHGYKNQQLREQFVHSLKNHLYNNSNQNVNQLLYQFKPQFKEKPLTRHDVLFSISKFKAQAEDKTISMLKKGYANPTYAHFEGKKSN